MPSLYLRDSLSHICYSSPNWPPNSPVFDILATAADHDTYCTQEALLVTNEETRMRRNFYHRHLSAWAWFRFYPGLCNCKKLMGSSSFRNHSPVYGMHAQSFTAGVKDLVYMLLTLLFPERQLAQHAFFLKNKLINDKFNNIQMTFLIKTAREPPLLFLSSRNACCDDWSCFHIWLD